MIETNIREAMRQEYRTAEHFLLDYTAERKKFAAELEEFLTQRRETGGSGVGDPTGSIAVKTAEFERGSASFGWLEAVRSVEEKLSDVELLLLKWRRGFAVKPYRRGKGRPPWQVFVMAKFATEQEKIVSDRTVRRLWMHLVRMVIYVKKERF